MRLSVFLLLIFNTFSIVTAEELDAKLIRTAITKAIPWLEKDMVAWRETNRCAACHHGPMYVWSSHVVKRQGYAVDEQQLQNYTQWLINDEQARVFPKATPEELAASSDAADRMTAAMMGHKTLSQPTLYLAHALNALPADDPLAEKGWRKLQQHWSAAQMDDGSFAGRKGWPPIFNSPQILTLFAATAIDDHLAAKRRDRDLAQSLDKMRKGTTEFLGSQKPDDTHQGIVLQLLAQTQRRGDQAPLLKALLVLQRKDGGWSQTPDRPSDAFATGQSLYVLSRAGVSLSEPSVARALHFLAGSQASDGTWPMTSRANPETGRPADDLNPITYAAAAWATIGMGSYVPSGR
jgi:hypothetical protein